MRENSGRNGRSEYVAAAHQRVVFYDFNLRAYPLVGWVPAANAQLQIVVRQTFRELSIEMRERDRFQVTADERLHKVTVLPRCQLTQHSVAFPRNVHRYLL